MALLFPTFERPANATSDATQAAQRGNSMTGLLLEAQDVCSAFHGFPVAAGYVDEYPDPSERAVFSWSAPCSACHAHCQPTVAFIWSATCISETAHAWDLHGEGPRPDCLDQFAEKGHIW